MNIQTWLTHAYTRLQESPTARLDAQVLLADCLDRDRGWLLAHPEHILQQGQLNKLDHQLTRRSAHEPLAYIRGKSEFYRREFIVTPATLQPRPETEAMIELLKKHYTNGSIADIGTGSGCLAITAKLEFFDAVVSATEINKDAIEVAKQNAKKLSADITFYKGNLLEPLESPADVVLANLPYVPDNHTINEAAMQEPSVAIFGGPDGLDLYRDMFGQIKLLEQKPKLILTESLPFQHEELAKIAKRHGYKPAETEGFIQVFTPE